MKKLILLPVFFSASMASAALPPYWDSVKQIETLLKAPALASAFHGHIVSVKSLGNLTYKVDTELCVATVQLEAQVPPPPVPVGPTTYALKNILGVDCE